jgi:transcriptional regulator with XRE-family HTH domain
MHPGLARLFRQLRVLREQAGFTTEQVEQQLVMGPGWVGRFERGEAEPTLGTLAALVNVYASDLPTFFSALDLGDTSIALDRHLTATSSGTDLRLHFPMGPHAAEVVLANASLEEFNAVLLELRNEMAAGKKREGIVACFLKAAATWPHVNPSDLWYFFVSHAYQDPYNHPAAGGDTDWGQSWKRAGGWALEAVYLQHYNPHLSQHGIRLEMPPPERKTQLLGTMGVTDLSGAQKSDVLVLGKRDGRRDEAFGVVHVKASFAERRTDDVPLSQQLMSRGHASPLVTMDCKASPGLTPVNRGELGAVQTSSGKASSKRLDIERDRKFDACFSYNKNTLATPDGQAAGARIYVTDFSNPDDAFSRYLVRKWRERQGLV